jgi:hypothetical protein
VKHIGTTKSESRDGSVALRAGECRSEEWGEAGTGKAK